MTKLEELREGFPETIKNYGIFVHGMKSAAATAGIFTLSGMAAILEKAANTGDTETIEKLHGLFVREWRTLKEPLSNMFENGKGQSEEKPVIGDEILRVLLEMLASHVNDMDIDGADETVRKLSNYKLPEKVGKEFEGLRNAVAQIDWESAGEILKRMKE